MGHRLSKIYTRTGDDGSTGLGDGTRVAKDCARVEAYGTVDEANSAIGVVLTHASVSEPMRDCLLEVQHDLFDLPETLADFESPTISSTCISGRSFLVTAASSTPEKCGIDAAASIRSAPSMSSSRKPARLSPVCTTS